MAKTLMLVAVCIGSGLVGALIALQLAEPDARDAPVPEAPSADADLGDVLVRLDRVEYELARRSDSPAGGPGSDSDLEDRVAGIERRLEAGAPGSPMPGPDAPLPEDASPAQLVRRAKHLAKTDRDYEAARGLLVKALEGNLTDQARMDALWELGVATRVLKDYGAADQAFLEMYRLAGSDSQRGVEALYQLAWTSSIAGDHGKAIAYIEDVLRSPLMKPLIAANARLTLAKFATQNGDPDRARAELTKIIEEHGGEAIEPGSHAIVKQARFLLGESEK